MAEIRLSGVSWCDRKNRIWS